MNVAVLCEFSGTVRDAFIRRGHNAVSYDLLPSEAPGPHVQGDVREKDLAWADLVIAHPTCTRLCNSGVVWLHRRNLWAQMREAAVFFKWCLDLPNAMVAVENPIMHKYAVEIVGRRQDQVIQPWMFGHGETKATCLWLRGLPKLTPTNIVEGREQRLHKLPPSPTRWAERSRTYRGIAEAMAEQWGGIVRAEKGEGEQ
jgi:hypothetical protein